ncbi:MAG TPA: site-2 protease family protein [Luteitalea sp.]|nr:site-2 protease family protein [Luteitalea sp.]
MTCVGCATDLAPSLLACPACHTLVHSDRLKVLAATARAAAARADAAGELSAWRDALLLLPPGSAQHRDIVARVDRLSADVIDAPADGSSRAAWSTGALAGFGLLAWKFKAVIAFVLTKGKLLALGLTNSTTALSMLPAIGVYWAVFGWPFAVGLVASIYVHEMGHVAALRRFGIAASAPMFLPGIGAVIRSRQPMVNPRERARVGLAGPIWGLGAAIAALAVYAATHAPIWIAIAQFGAWINLFNLTPIWQLDGAHAFSAMNRRQRWLVAFAVAAAFVLSREGLLILVAACATLQAWKADEGPGDGSICLQTAALVAALVGLIVVLPDAALAAR